MKRQRHRGALAAVGRALSLFVCLLALLMVAPNAVQADPVSTENVEAELIAKRDSVTSGPIHWPYPHALPAGSLTHDNYQGEAFHLAQNRVAAARARDTAALWSDLAKGGHVALMRHALAPGTGDPEEFQLDACETQRNLNDEGRDQARRTGEAFRRNGVAVGKVLSSEWCRCVETAELMKLAAVEKLPALNSFFEARENEPAQTRAVRSMLTELDPAAPSVLMVTHQVNITALTGVFPQSGEIVVLKLGGPGGFTVVGRIPAR